MWVTAMIKVKLDEEEQEILHAFEEGSLKRVGDLKRELAAHRKVAEATFKKDSRINIRISSKDLRALQKRALAEGIPYQTLVSSVLHKFAEGRLTEKTDDARQAPESSEAG